MRLTSICTLLLALPLFSCNSSGDGESETTAPETGTLSISATDAPFDHAIVEEATVRIDRISVHADAAADSGFLVIYEGDPIEMNLADLRNGVTRALVSAEVPAASYRQARLRVSSAYLRLIDGDEFRTEDNSLRLSSQDTSGFKVFIQPAIEVVGGFSTELLLDFDLTKTFKAIPASDPLDANFYKLHPVIRAANLSESGEIRGILQAADGSGGFAGVADATVYIMAPGETDTDNSIASAGTAGDGGWAVIGLPAGEYDVIGKKDALSGRVNGVEVSVGSVSTADMIIQ